MTMAITSEREKVAFQFVCFSSEGNLTNYLLQKFVHGQKTQRVIMSIRYT